MSKSRASDEFLKDAQMQSKVEVLFDVETFVNIKEILGSVQKLINSGKFSSLGDSNVVQFKKEFHDINFGFWGNIVSGRRKQDKAANVKVLKNQFLKLFHTSKLLDVESICWDEVEMTALSRHSVNDKSPPAIRADEMSGKVICLNARAGVAPRSAAASSSDSSSPASRARTISVTTALAYSD